MEIHNSLACASRLDAALASARAETEARLAETDATYDARRGAIERRHPLLDAGGAHLPGCLLP